MFELHHIFLKVLVYIITNDKDWMLFSCFTKLYATLNHSLSSNVLIYKVFDPERQPDYIVQLSEHTNAGLDKYSILSSV
jgi:hypothetical protein